MARQKLTVFLLREEVKTPGDALRSAMTVIPVDASLGANGGLVVKEQPAPTEPAWKGFIAGVTTAPLPALKNQSSAAVLFVEASDRLFAITFGYGRALLDIDQVEPMFGLKVVINRVDADRLRSIDIRTFQATQFQIRQQAAGVSPLDTFGLDVRRDVLNAVAGKPTADTLGSTLAGKDSLSTSLEVAPGNIKLFCEDCWSAFCDDVYKERFGWIDTLRVVRDQKTVDLLDNHVVKKMQANALDGLDLMMPDIIDPERVTGFKYSGIDARDELHSDIDLADLLGIVVDLTAVSVDWLKRKEIKYYDASETSAIGHWSIYKCLAAQVSLASTGPQYVLSSGTWYEVDDSYVSEINSQVRDIEFLPLSDLVFPACEDDTMAEEDYNWAAAETLGAYCQDQKLVYLGGQKNRIEPCDIFTATGQLIHVKRKTRSSSLSHLFAQARVSAELLRRDKGFNDKWIKQLKADNAKSFASLLKWPCKPASHEIVLAILAPNCGQLPEELPFFAKMELVGLVQSLKEVGFSVSFAGVHEVVATRKKVSKK
ncbi:MAG: TIGR04141 family sporadically distributed protein [Fimbriimonadaceae bacterium]|nr:TIGR04141 family sporadically distributed protein [Fimbriimonadaceae bacterium]